MAYHFTTVFSELWESPFIFEETAKKHLKLVKGQELEKVNVTEAIETHCT